jgi:group I intron endonuclease
MINTNKLNPIIGIYKIISPSKKIYIGQSIDVYNRWRLYSLINCKGQPKLYNSLKKHGFEKHVFEIIEECSLEQLDEREIFWKKHYLNQFDMNWKRVLFCKIYDNGGGPLTQEMKDKISKANKGKPKSEQHKNNMKTGRKGMTFTQQHKDNMSNSRFRYKVLCIENNIMYRSAHQASKDLNLYPAAILDICRGKYYQTKGYTFKFV